MMEFQPPLAHNTELEYVKEILHPVVMRLGRIAGQGAMVITCP